MVTFGPRRAHYWDETVEAGSEVIMDQFEAPRGLVCFESMFGNTEAVAKAIAEGLSDHVSTTIEDVVTARPHADNVDLLVVGAPTHAFGLSWRQTRMSAASQGARAPQSELIGLREWLEALVPPSLARRQRCV